MELYKYKDIYYFGDYYNYWIFDDQGNKYENPDFSKGLGKQVLDIKNNRIDGIKFYSDKIIEFIEHVNDKDKIEVITYVPSSKKDTQSKGMESVLNTVCKHFNNKIEFIECLSRTQEIKKLAHGGDRSKSVHFDSISVKNEDYLKGKNILVFDDVTTTGNSLQACKEILKNAGVNLIQCYSLGKTVDVIHDEKALEDARNFFELDKCIKVIINEEFDGKNVIEGLISKYNRARRGFIHFWRIIERKNLMEQRMVEVYRYLLSQVNILSRLEYFCDYQDSEELDILKLMLYRSLIFETYQTQYIVDFFKLMINVRTYKGTCYDYTEIMYKYDFSQSFEIGSYTIDCYSFDKLIARGINSRGYNDIANAFYVVNTESSLKKALEYINIAILKKADCGVLHYNKALIYIKMGELKNALSSIKDANLCMVKKHENSLWFQGGKDKIISWLKEINELVNSAETNHYLGMFMYEYSLETGIEYWSERRKRFDYKNNKKDNIKLTAIENEILKYLHLASTKSDNLFKSKTEQDLVNKSEENYQYMHSGSLKDKKGRDIYKFKKNLIDEWNQLESKIGDEDIYYTKPSEPDWLGGFESEEEFWEH